MAFADVISGLAGASHEYHTNLLKMDYEKKTALAQHYGKLAEDESYPEEMRAEALKRALTIHTLEPGKKLPKEFESFTFQIPPKSVPGAKAQTQPASAGMMTAHPPAAETEPLTEGELRPGGVPEGQGLAALSGTIPPPLPFARGAGQLGIQAPEIPPGLYPGETKPFAPMPFEEQVRRTHEMARAKAKPVQDKKIFNYPQFDPETGDTTPTMVFQHEDPDTGEISLYEQDVNGIQRPFAPRFAQGGTLTGTDLGKLKAAGLPSEVDFTKDKDLIPKILEVLPNANFGPIGGGRYYVTSPRSTFETFNNTRVAVNPLAPQAPGTVLGTARPPVTSEREITIPLPGGKLGKTTLGGTTSVQTGQTPQPTPPPIGQVQPSPASFGQQQAVITEDTINTVLAANKGLTREAAITALKNGGWAEPGQTPTVSQPVSAQQAPPPQAPPTMPQTGGVTEIQGAGRRLGAKEGTDMETRAGILGTTIGRGAGALKFYESLAAAPNKLSNFLKRARMEIVSNPQSPTAFSLIVNNMSDLTPEEQQFAGDYIALGEDINVLRAITNATGFRGPQAFEVLLGQRGHLLGNPGVFKTTLKNSLLSIITQVGPMNKTLLDSGRQIPISQDIFNGYMAVYGPDRKAVADALRRDRWIQ